VGAEAGRTAARVFPLLWRRLRRRRGRGEEGRKLLEGCGRRGTERMSRVALCSAGLAGALVWSCSLPGFVRVTALSWWWCSLLILPLDGHDPLQIYSATVFFLGKIA
jgi:hypothetical protein